MLFIALFLFLTQLEKRVVIELIMLPIQDLYSLHRVMLCAKYIVRIGHNASSIRMTALLVNNGGDLYI